MLNLLNLQVINLPGNVLFIRVDASLSRYLKCLYKKKANVLDF